MASSFDWPGLLQGEITLVLTVAAGLAFGKLLLALSVPERVMRLLLPEGRRTSRTQPDILFALALSLGSSRAGAAIVAEARREGRVTDREAVFGTLMQAFPGYLKRFVVTFPTALGLAGLAGAVFSLVVLLRSFVRFVFFLFLVRRPAGDEAVREATGACDDGVAEMPRGGRLPLLRTLSLTLPLACTVYALAYLLTPSIQRLFEERGAWFPLLSSAGWTVAAASFAHANAALSVAGGAIAAGTLTTAQGVLALLVGNMLAALSRVLRQDLAFWLGIFPGRMVRSLFFWNYFTLVALMLASIAIAAVPVVMGC